MASRSNTRTTRAPGSDRSTSMATHVARGVVDDVEGPKRPANRRGYRARNPSTIADWAESVVPARAGGQPRRVYVGVDAPAAAPRDRAGTRACDSPASPDAAIVDAAADTQTGDARPPLPAGPHELHVVSRAAIPIRRPRQTHQLTPPAGAYPTAVVHQADRPAKGGPPYHFFAPLSVPGCPRSAPRRSASTAGSRPRAASAASRR